jgi:hypothetical protein
MFKKIAGWFKRHPGFKRTVVGVAGAAANAAAMGVFGPKAAAVGAIVGALTANSALEIEKPKAPAPVEQP